ncbi:hypothetical protein COLO4_22577 [Corchorus olitorius]|uniref:Uncharacterized protein n=1 Tax=Corchorus olitorius TaxID=93759 RepID=A0A1R3ILE2_9ROSI|nr:hypothetical protein COLO4_22577 [Corchorus olitorius]
MTFTTATKPDPCCNWVSDLDHVSLSPPLASLWFNSQRFLPEKTKIFFSRINNNPRGAELAAGHSDIALKLLLTYYGKLGFAKKGNKKGGEYEIPTRNVN